MTINLLGRVLSAYRPYCLCLSLVGVLLVSAPKLDASLTFDWPSSPGWTAGAPTPGQTRTQGFTNVNPNDVVVAINNNGAGAQGLIWQASYPQNSFSSDTGGFTGVNGLQYLVASSQVFGSYVQTTISFDTPVINLSFEIWDVDAVAGQFVDQISNIQALAFGGGTVGPDSVTSAVGGYNSISGTGLATVVLGTANASNTTNQGTIAIIFNGPITQFSFEWSNNDPALGAQGIALGPVTYSPVPEIQSLWIGASACVVAIGHELFRRRRNRNRR